eukprot:Em0016g646a
MYTLNLTRYHHSYLEKCGILTHWRENKQLRDSVLRLEEENCNLAQEVVESKVELRSQMDKLKVRIDEHKALKTTAGATLALIKDPREEVWQSKEDYQKVVMKLTEDQQQHDSCVTEYKRVGSGCGVGRRGAIKSAKLGSSPSSSVGQEASPEAVAKELRARDLEMELAQTKLELVRHAEVTGTLNLLISHYPAPPDAPYFLRAVINSKFH